jgi:hypothetical protein
MVSDPFGGGNTKSAMASPRSADPVVYDTPFATMSTGMWCAAAGNLSVVMADGNTRIWLNIPAGTELSLQCSQVTSANTTITAANLLALW